MKAAVFDYVRASSLAEACALLSDAGDDTECKLLAGGQTLVPLMAMRLARPTRLIDLNAIDELSHITLNDDSLSVGAMSRQRCCEESALVNEHLPLLARALPQIGHQQTRNRGTLGGSLVNADPASEIPLVACTLSAELHIQNHRASRIVNASEFFQGPMMTAVAEDEILTQIDFPLWPETDHVGVSFVEMAPRQGDYALASAAVQILLGSSGECLRVAIGVGACGPTPIKLNDLEDALIGQVPDEELLKRLSQTIDQVTEPEDTLQASADYRRRVAPVLLFRALSEAVAEARQ